MYYNVSIWSPHILISLSLSESSLPDFDLGSLWAFGEKKPTEALNELPSTYPNIYPLLPLSPSQPPCFYMYV